MKNIFAISIAILLFGCAKNGTENNNESPKVVNGLDAKFLGDATVIGGCAQLNQDGSYTICFNMLSKSDGSVNKESVQKTCQEFQRLTGGVPYKTVESCATENMATACLQKTPSMIQITYSDASPESVTSSKEQCSKNGNEVLF